MNLLPLLTSQPGAGRTLLAANLAPLLSAQAKAPVLLLEHAKPEESELSLYFSLPSAPDLAGLPSTKPLLEQLPKFEKHSVYLASLTNFSPQACHNFAPQLEPFAWVLLDGLSLLDSAWDQVLEACGRGLLLERGDQVGARRMNRLLARLEEAGFPKTGLVCVWSEVDPSQPLENPQGLPVASIASYPKVIERLAQGLLPSLSDASSPFAKSLQGLAKQIMALPPMPQRAKTQAPAHAQAASAPQDLMASLAPSDHKHASERTLLLRKILNTLLEQLDLKKIENKNQNLVELRQQWQLKVSAAASALLAQENAPWLDREERAALTKELVSHILGYGPLEEPLADPEITEIMVNSKDQVYLEKRGKLALSPIRFWDNAQLLGVIERIVAPLGRRIDESSPRVDARLPDGSRVNAIIPPLALKGPCITIRKFPSKRLRMEDLIAFGALTPPAAEFLKTAALLRKNVVVSGGTGSGKTTLLNVLSSFIPEGERIITIEDAAELKLDQEHVVSLESRPANLEGKGAVTIRDLVANSLRMRPDRIVVGECRGGEALDMLQAMNTGHEGSLTTVHANSPRDALGRLETLCLMADLDLPLRVVRSQIASAVDLIVQIARLKDGSRKLVAITEVTGMEGETIVLQDIFLFRQSGFDDKGKVLGQLHPTGVVPQFFHQAKEAGVQVDLALFR